MNRKYVLYNLEEAHEEIELIMRDLRRNPDYTGERFFRAMQHLVHHVNIAWNARDAPADAHETATEGQIERWGQYPTDFKLM